MSSVTGVSEKTLIWAKNELLLSTEFIYVNNKAKILLGCMRCLYEDENFLKLSEKVLIDCLIELLGTQSIVHQSTAFEICRSLCKSFKVEADTRILTLQVLSIHAYQLLLWVLRECPIACPLWDNCLCCFFYAMDSLPFEPLVSVIDKLDPSVLGGLFESSLFLSSIWTDKLINYFELAFFADKIQLRADKFAMLCGGLGSLERSTFIVCKWINMLELGDLKELKSFARILLAAALQEQNVVSPSNLFSIISNAESFCVFLKKVCLLPPLAFSEAALQECKPLAMLSSSAVDCIAQLLSCLGDLLERAHRRTMMGKLCSSTASIIHGLLHSELVEDRDNGMKWLLQLLCTGVIGWSTLESILIGILEAPLPEVQKTFYIIIMAVFEQARCLQPLHFANDGELTAWVNCMLTKSVVDHGESGLQNTLIAAHILFLLLLDVRDQERNFRREEITNMILHGTKGIKKKALNAINSLLLKQLYCFLANAESIEKESAMKTKQAMLVLLVLQSQEEAFYRAIGGPQFFNNLLESSDPFVLLVASEFLINRVSLLGKDIPNVLVKKHVWSATETHPLKKLNKLRNFLTC
ncbi:uncharacterized protein LOC135122211 isoform X2 [Zophobas morio]|uniref:uncharacterized protein LOC135122211 isoform X2 n=1 Tax=Zophobas morio TaxID=2755281 RepID=UPI003083749D